MAFNNTFLGPNVYVFSAKDDVSEINKTIADIYRIQEANHFGDERTAMFFMKGDYSEVVADMGFYTQIAGLGTAPADVKLGTFRNLARWTKNVNNNNACCNFWRSVENLEIESDAVFAVSQATDMRRVDVKGDLYLHDHRGSCSGGFLADTRVTGRVDAGSQQQWFSRDCTWNDWKDYNWNMVFAGIEEKVPSDKAWPEIAKTELSTTDIVREKPFLVCEEGRYGVYVPGVKKSSKGAVRAAGPELPEGDTIIPIEAFYVAHEGDSAEQINKELRRGKHLLLTPGIYTVDTPITVTHENTVVLGLGLATLRSVNGSDCLHIDDKEGIIVAGILLDAGVDRAKCLMTVGDKEKKVEKGHRPFDDIYKVTPICLSDIYFRVGGAKLSGPASCDCCLIIDADNVIGDNFWVWRADHGAFVGWDKNICTNGVIVNGDNVIIYGLMVEHFHEYQTIWNGHHGRIVMYQSEMPYDVPEQSAWMSNEGKRLGYASIYVSDLAEDFKAYGVGIYIFHRDTEVYVESAMEVADKPGICVYNVCTFFLPGHRGMNHIVNDAGEPLLEKCERKFLTYYENKKAE